MIKNEKLANYPFLQEMYRDSYFPDFLVDKGKAILVSFCERIETEQPKDLAALYVLSHKTTEAFNALNEEFLANDSDIETVARDCIGVDFKTIALAYGFDDVDTEELISPRDW